jgi:hypothetical protein
MDMSESNETAAEPLQRAQRPAGARIKAAPKQRAASEAREPVRAEGQRLRRQRTRNDDAFHIPQSMIPPGMSYEWKRESVYGKPDGRHQIALRENHWRPVPASRHPELVPDVADKDGAIRLDGQVLMERPAYLTEEARKEGFDDAMEQVHRKETQLKGGAAPEGTFTRDHPSVRANTKLGRSYEPLRVPEE